jgi:hypothetical protein
MLLLIKLLIAHLLGDFFLQPASWIRDKTEKKFKSGWLYLHALLHGALSMLVVWDIQFWWMALIIMISHLLIDGLKMTFQNEKNGKYLFLIDQALHVLVIVWVSYYWSVDPLFPGSLLTEEHLLYLAAMLLVSMPASVLIKTMISRWMPFNEVKQNNSLQDAGKYIGILERLFVLAFIVSGHWEGIGFLIAAKSVFRFGDIKQYEGLKLTEYFMIGTLLSFGIAIFTGLLVLELTTLL